MTTPTERERLAELVSFGVLDTAPEPSFDALVDAAADALDCPTALVSLIDVDRQWFKARRGLEAQETPRDVAFCDHVVRTDAPLVVPDATADKRFATNPLVTGQLGIRFYAGHPLRTASGAVLGTLCVLDYKPRPAGLSHRQQRLLAVLADQVMAQLELRRGLKERDTLLCELRTASEGYRVLAEDATDVVSRHTLDGTTIYVSPSVHSVLGYDPAAEVGAAAPERVHPEDAPALGDALGKVMSGEAATAAVRSRHADGSWRHMDIRLSPIRDDAGSVVQLHSVARDVTEQIQAQQAALAAEQRFRVLFDSSPLGIVELSPAGVVQKANAAIAALVGAPSPAALVGKTPAWATVPGQRTAQEESLRQAAAEPGQVLSTERTIVRADGTEVEIAGTVVGVRAPNGELEMLIGSVVDITERNRDQRTLHEANRKLRLLVDAAGDAFVGMESTGRITDWNRQAEATFGWPAEEALGRSLADTIIPLQHRKGHRAGMARFLATDEEHILDQRIEITALDRHGREFPVELTVWAVDRGTNSVSFYAFVHDISERRAYQDAQRILADQLAAAQQIAGIGSWEWDIAADKVTWSDELCRIFGVDPTDFVATFQGYLDHVHPEDRELAASAVGAAFENNRAFAFDHRVLRPDGTVTWVHGRGQVEMGADGVPARMSGTAADITERVALQQELVALALVDDLTGLHNRRGFITLADHQLKVAARSGRPVPLLFVDMDGMKSINDNYGHNEGDRALEEVAAFLRTVVRDSDIVARVGGDEFCILIVDGDGVTDVDRVAAELRPGPPQGERRYPLPLSVGMALLEAGSETSIDDLMTRADRAMYADKSAQRRQARVLVVEDDAGLRRLAELSLRFGYDVSSAATGSAALVAAAEHLPDLVLLDLNLPDMHGTEVLRRLRALPGGDRVAVIVLTGTDRRDTELESLQEGVDDYVTKPVDLDILEARIKNVLNRSMSRPRRLGA